MAEIDEHGDFRIVMPAEACSYLPAETASLEYRVSRTMTSERFETLLARGWRRFADYYFRPACPSCRQCRSLRVDVAAFAPSRSQRRALQKNSDLQLTVGRPTVTAEHIELFNRYHADMHGRRNWPYRQITVADYIDSFVGSVSFAREFQYFDQETLVGVGLVDVTAKASSSAYFYHDPAYRAQAIGTYSLIQEILDARAAGRRWHYLGYWIRDCQSMAYKNRYAPHELLERYVGDADAPVWSPPEPTD